jgi:hypothetical protein
VGRYVGRLLGYVTRYVSRLLGYVRRWGCRESVKVTK